MATLLIIDRIIVATVVSVSPCRQPSTRQRVDASDVSEDVHLADVIDVVFVPVFKWLLTTLFGHAVYCLSLDKRFCVVTR